MRRLYFLAVFSWLLVVSIASATIFGTVRGVVHDPQHRPIADASVKLKSATSEWTETTQTDQDGAFTFSAVPVGDYLVTVTKSGFADDQQSASVVSNSSPTLHYQLNI